MDIEPQLVFKENLSSLGPRDCEEGAQSRDVVVNQRNIMNPVADMAALCRFYRSRTTGTLEPDGTGVWPHGALVM